VREVGPAQRVLQRGAELGLARRLHERTAPRDAAVVAIVVAAVARHGGGGGEGVELGDGGEERRKVGCENELDHARAHLLALLRIER
jgi:hypothetical protein